MTMATAPTLLTLDEFLELPEKKPALEYEEGRVAQKVSPKGKHSRLQVSVASGFNGFAEPRRLALAFTELRTTFAGQSRVPDVAVYRWDRIPRTATGEVADEFREAPDLVVEIVSSGQSVNALIRRCIWYVAHGVLIALLVDPKDRSISLFRPNALPVSLRGDDRIPLGDVLPGLELTVDDIFRSLQLS